MRRLPFVIVLVVIAMLAAACGDSDDATTPSGTAEAAAEPGSESDDTVLSDDFADSATAHAQETLDALGYHAGTVDGIYGSHTTEAVKAFQTDYGLDETGILDATTANALSTAAENSPALMVDALQTELVELRYYEGRVDGDFGPETVTAVKAFQEAQGLDASGSLDPATAEALAASHHEEVRSEHIEASGATPASPESEEGQFRAGDEGAEIAEMQKKLEALGYRPGTTDGRYGAETASAVLAFQKAEGLERDSIAGAEVLGRLDEPQAAGPKSDAAGPRVEVDLDRQIMFVIDPAGNVTTINVSTGSGREYQSAEEGKGIVTAHTPTGDFVVERSIDGLREAPLGTLYRPLYFQGGWAIHGNPNVPGYPASHGCVRTANWDQDFVFDVISDGDTVQIYGRNPDDPPNAAAGA